MRTLLDAFLEEKDGYESLVEECNELDRQIADLTEKVNRKRKAQAERKKYLDSLRDQINTLLPFVDTSGEIQPDARPPKGICEVVDVVNKAGEPVTAEYVAAKIRKPEQATRIALSKAKNDWKLIKSPMRKYFAPLDLKPSKED